MTRPERIQIAAIVSAHGIRGQVKIRALTPYFEDLASAGALTSADGNRAFSLTIHSAGDRGFIASIGGVTDRNQAELLRGTGLYASAEKLPENAPETLVGLAARLADGSSYGTVTGIFNFGAGDVVEISTPDGKSEMLPLKEGFAEVKEGFILVTPPHYLEAKES